MQQNLQKKDIIGFLGTNLRHERVDLVDQNGLIELARCVNIDKHVFPGTLSLRGGRTQLTTNALSATIRRMGKVNSIRYRVAGSNLYRTETIITDYRGTSLGSNSRTSIVGFKPLNDTTTWAFVADRAVMQKDSGTVTRRWGLPAPTTFSVVQLNSGTYTYICGVSQIRFDGTTVAHEGNPLQVTITEASGGAGLPSGGFALYNIPHPSDPQVNGLGVYRTVDTGSSLLLEERIQIPTDNEYATSYEWEVFNLGTLSNTSSLQLQFTINLDDVPTADQQNTTDNTAYGTQLWEPGFVQTQFGSLGQRNQHYFMQNSEDSSGYRGTYRWEIADGYVATETFTWCYLTDTADASLGAAAATNNSEPPACDIAASFNEHMFLAGNSVNPHRLFWSKRYLPESIPATFFTDIGNADDPIRALASYVGLLGVLTRDTKYYVTGNETAGFVATEAVSRRGVVGQSTFAVTDKGVIFVARDGVYATSFIGTDKELSAKIRPLFEGQTVNSESPINFDVSDTFACEFFGDKFYFSYATTGNTVPNRLAIYSLQTQEWYFTDIAARSLLTEDDTNALQAGYSNGHVYTLESGATDDGSSIALAAQTKDFWVGARALFLGMKVDAEAQDGITVGFVIDDVEQHSVTLTGSRTKSYLPLPEDAWGNQWRMTFAYTGSRAVRVYGANVFYLPLNPSI